ncbi:MAG: hypothetical protein LBD97_09690 [Bifidobacteriaceae bacterium]|jgi:hypothetical protein|nr:hypothetical protein [Bifidobacteriaceae bacterium]
METEASAPASLRLKGITALGVEETAELLKNTADDAKGGASSSTSGATKKKTKVRVVWSQGGTLEFAIDSGRDLFSLCTFSADAVATPAGTEVRVGGLETYRTEQETVLGLIRVGPETITGLAPYRRFLEACAQAIKARDASARLVIEQPE